MEPTRRDFMAGGLAVGTATAGGTALAQEATERAQNRDAEFPRERPGRGGPIGSPTDRGKLVGGRRAPGLPPVAVETPDLPKLPWKMVGGVKEFHLHAQVVRREFLHNMTFWVWGYNGTMPGPIIEATTGDRVRIVVHNELPEPTTVHWHGLELPIKFDGVPGLTQDPIMPGKSFAYEFDLHQDGTFFYHSHGPMQEVMGMTGLFIIHPKVAYEPTVDKDFGLILQQFPILPQNDIPNSLSEEFNFFTINGRSGPMTTPMVVRLGDRVRIRTMNLSAMHNHPMHLHGHTFWLTGNEGGRVPESAWIPSNNVLVSVGQARDVEFVANNPGDWLFHCHILHHMMNHMTSMVRMPDMRGGHGGMGRMLTGPGDFAAGTGMNPEGPALSDENGPAFGRGLGPQTESDRAAMNGAGLEMMRKDPKFAVPGFPQDMMDMKLMQMGKMAPMLAAKRETHGMRRNWFTGVEAMMTVVRVLPPDLYDKVIAGQEVEPGLSVPGGGPGQDPKAAAASMKMMDHKPIGKGADHPDGH
jgi:FtsP/CotA-like multicopper oxidase with cupredoxin domain